MQLLRTGLHGNLFVVLFTPYSNSDYPRILLPHNVMRHLAYMSILDVGTVPASATLEEYGTEIASKLNRK